MNQEIIDRVQKNNEKGEELVAFLQKEISSLKEIALQKSMGKAATELREENIRLKQEVEKWKNKVIELETLNGIQQCSLPSSSDKLSNTPMDQKSDSQEKKIDVDIPANQTAPAEDVTKNQSKKEKKDKESKKENVPKAQKTDTPSKEEEISVARLDLRVGRILTAKKHPDAESLYVEDVDIGENKPRTVVSGLVKFVPLEEMQNRLVIVLCNLKPAKMRGVASEAMVMCASTPEKVEILSPPEGSVPGDRVTCDGFSGEPDLVLPPKKKIFEQVAPDLKTNDECIATYKSSPLRVPDKGVITAPTLTGVQIK